MTDNENRVPAVARKSRLGLGQGPNQETMINRENKQVRAPLGVIVENIPDSRQPKQEKKFAVFRDNPLKNVTTYQQIKASTSRAAAGGTSTIVAVASGRSGFKVHVDSPEKDEDKENEPRSKLSTATKVEVDKDATEHQSCDLVATSSKLNFSNILSEKDDRPCGGAGAVSRRPLSSLDSKDNYSESPMVLDLSTNSSKENLFGEEGEDQAVASSSAKKSVCSDLTVDEMLLPYADETYAYLREVEVRCRAKPNYMKKQTDISNGMRSILIDWLVEVGSEYNLHQETLYLTVSYVDRFLSCMSVLRGKLQLVGAACMFVAAKFEEVHPPEVEEFVYITDDTYTKRQVIRMEHVILKVLSFNLAVPTNCYFIQRFCHVSETDEQTYFLAMYLSELTMLEADPYLQFLPSIIAGTSVCLARHTQDLEPWPESLIKFSGYTMDSFKECSDFLLRTFINAPNYPQQSIREKFSAQKYMEVASISPPSTQLF